MQAYTGFAQVYDLFMDNVPYDNWTEYLAEILDEYGISDGLVLELGCGTGNITRRLAARGYDMIGIDNSEEMLEVARDFEYDSYSDEVDEENEDVYKEVANDMANCEKTEYSSSNIEEDDTQRNHILYLEQDMREFELYGTVSAVVSICDSMNYITSDKDLLKVFKLVNNYLDANGIFIFDMNTEYKYKYILADNTIAENREDCSFIWENYYNEDKMLNEYDVTIYVKLDGDDKEEQMHLFERFQETHYQKAYSIESIKGLLVEAGMEFVAVYDAFTHNPPTDTSERVYFIAREKYQVNKKY